MQNNLLAQYFSQSCQPLTRSVTNFDTCAISFITGVCATLLFHDLISLRLLMLVILIVGLAVRIQTTILPILIVILGFTWATLSFTNHFNNELPIDIEGQTIIVTGQIQNLPQNKPQSSRFHFRISSANSSSGVAIPELTNQTTILSCYHCYLEFLPDQVWQLSVRLKRPHSYASWGAFDYEKYLFRHQIIATGYIRIKDQNDFLFSSAGFSINQWRWKISQSLNQALVNNDVGRAIVGALTVGDKSQFSNEQQLVFQKTGISHLLAISGLHIGLAFLVSAWLFKWCLAPIAQIYNYLPRQRLVLIPALLSAFSYAALAGFAISTQRAMIMLSLYVFARFFARQLSLLKVLLIAVVVIFMIDPFSILDVGFWLSCSAVFVIGLIAEYKKTHQTGGEQETDDQSNKLSLIKLQPLLWLGMLPVTLLFFGKISILSPFVNLLLVPLFCSVLIPFTLFALVLDLSGLVALSHILLQVLSYCYVKVYWLLLWLTELPFAQIALPPMRSFEWIVCVLLIVAYFFAWRIRHGLLSVFIVLLVGFNQVKNMASNEFNVTLLDVGQGLAMVVEGPDYVLVYDTGPAFSSGFNTAEAVLIPYLQHRGIRHIDTLIISHADNDHIGGLGALLEAFEVTQILTSRVDKVPGATNCVTGQSWSVSSLEFNIVSPDQNTPEGSNNRSCVLRISNGYKTVLISGDIERQVEQYLLRDGVDLSADVLLVPHQGSKTSSTVNFIDAVDPYLALIAAGYRNHYGHPHKDVVTRYQQRNIKVVSTIEGGSILLNIKNNSIILTSYRESEKGFWNHIKKPT